MNLRGIACVISLLPAATLALCISAHDDVETITDKYLFETSLEEFSLHRAAAEPPTVIWDSDGCTLSPDNPLGFEFEPACNRHDFGYKNYRDQDRFTKAAKASIDSNFRKEHQCTFEHFKSICNAFAEAYHAAAKAFGGSDATKSAESDAVAEYEEKLVIYNEMLAEVNADGQIPLQKDSSIQKEEV
ncbi:hypothetical protein VSDG_05319 [Cytospora chrysosperma]|uniref:Phospholipase A2 domain-containing protein n=1 Tax=Cytospora chrysosperma TaxID=252740 RepID=A0A423VX11_CYTCH|nr:hypothetical protein VSDG_05319 [Valsa sordida]